MDARITDARHRCKLDGALIIDARDCASSMAPESSTLVVARLMARDPRRSSRQRLMARVLGARPGKVDGAQQRFEPVRSTPAGRQTGEPTVFHEGSGQPHRDDVVFELEGREAGTFASQGQLRAIMLAWKSAELDARRC